MTDIMKKNHSKVKATGYTLLLVFFLTLFLSSCSNNDYVNAIPSTVTALVKVDATKLDADKVSKVFSALIPVENAAYCGIDWSSNLFAFETIDGNFGLCAKVNSESKLADTFDSLVKKGKCSNMRKQGELTFVDVDNAWAVGYSDNTLVVLGPVSAVALPDAQRRISRMLRQDVDASIQSRPMFAKLDSMKSAVSMVAQIQALPERFIVPFTIGVPKEADASQIFVAVTFSKDQSVVRMNGEIFSFNKTIDAALKKSFSSYRKIEGDYLSLIPFDCYLGLFFNVDGKIFLQMLQSNKSMHALLTGFNMAIDFDNIIRSVDGDLVFVTNGMFSDKTDITMYAKMTHPSWLGDVEYWKKSCIAGSSITGTTGAWMYNSGDMHFAFGLMDNIFYGTTNNKQIPTTVHSKISLITKDVQNVIKGNRIVMLLNLSSVLSESALPEKIGCMVNSVLGDVKTVTYIME